MKFKVFIILLILGLNDWGQAQVDSSLHNDLKAFELNGLYRSAVSANFSGVTGLIGLSYDVLLSKKWAFEIGGGFPGAGAGFTWFPWPVERGKERFHIAQRSVFFFAPWEPNKFQHALCFGLTFFSEKPWNWGIDLGPVYEHSTSSLEYLGLNNPDANINLMLNFKAGYRFSFKAMKYKRRNP